MSLQILFQAAYLRIYFKLRYRFAQGFVSRDESSSNSRRQLRGRRLQKTNILLISIAIMFCISWLPLNVFNLVADLSPSANFHTQPLIVAYAICHMMGMSSACSNPVLYGWLNDNFWKEFKDIMCIKSNNENGSETQRFSLRKPSHKTLSSKPKPDLLTDYQQGTTMNTEMSVLNS